jgi:hypothetical protein
MSKLRLKSVHFKPGRFHPKWKGDNVGYWALHEWVRKRFSKPELCQMCNKVPPRDLANKSGKYLRDLLDWEYLCHKCHMNKDGQMKKAWAKIPKEERYARIKKSWIKRKQNKIGPMH